MPWSRDVFSSNAASISYDEATQTMEVVWRRGKNRVSVYEGVPEAIADQASRAMSVGTFLRENVRDRFPHRYGR